MRKMTLIQRRMVWIVIAVATVLVGMWLMNALERSPAPPRSELTSSPGQQAAEEMRSMKDMGTSASLEEGPAQAYAMVAPFKQQLIGVKTAVVEKRPLETMIRAVGRVDYDEQRIAHVNLRVSGWIEELFVDYTGQRVRKGQPLFTLYSPDLVATQDEYLLALRVQDKVKDSPIPEVGQQAEQMVEAARDRLRLWTLTDEQLNEVARRGKAQTYVTIRSPIAGHVIDKKVFKGMFVEPEMRLYTITDLSTVWINAEIYEYEVPFVQMGQLATVTFSSYPGEQFHGRVSYVYPYLNKEARTVKVRLELPNPGVLLKPDMYGDVLIRVNRGTNLAIPEQAVLDSGKRTLVFVVRGEGLFEPRTVKLGQKIGPYYEVREGLTEGERVVTSGNFLIDSESKLMAATNMMGALGMGGIRMEQAQMGKMEMGGMESMGMEGMKGMGGKKVMPGMKSEPGQPVSETRQVSGFTLTFTTLPEIPKAGEAALRLKVTDPAGYAVANAQVVFVYTMPMPGMSESKVTGRHTKDGVYEGKAMLGMGGMWVVTVTVTMQGLEPVTEKFQFTVAGGGT